MKKWFLPLAALLTVACAKEREVPALVQPVKETVVEAGEVTIPGVAEVRFEDSLLELIEQDLLGGSVKTKSQALNGVLADLGIISCERIFSVDPENEEEHRAFGLHRWYRVTFNPDVPATKASQSMLSVEGISNVNPVYRKAQPAAYFNDPLLPQQWNYENNATKWADVNVVPVWKEYTVGDPNVIVSVVDAGIDPTHEDLKANFLPGGPDGSKNFMSGAGGYKIVAGTHGTHVGGTIAAVSNNGKGVAGIAGGDAAKGIPGVKLMSCQVFQDNAGYGNFEDAMVWGADHGAVISNNSWGHDHTDSKGNYNKDAAKEDHDFYVKPNTGDYRSAFKDAVDYFNSHAGMKSGNQVGPMAGGIMFFAAGNDGQPYGAPGCYPECMSVGAITSYGTRTTFSNYGDWVHICAPGLGIISTYPDNEYGELSGTSMACPHVTGVAALVISYCGGPGFTREALWDKMIGGANNADIPSSYRIGPLVDALGAITFGTGEPPAAIGDFTVDNVVSNNVFVTAPVTADKDGHPAYGICILASESKAELLACNPAKPGGNIITGSFLTREAGVGENVSGSIGDLGFSKHYYVTVSAFDYGRNFSAISTIKEVDTGINHDPVITTTYTGDYKFHVHDRFTIPFTITDEDLHVINVEFDKDVNDEGGALRLLESVKAGEYQLQVVGNLTPEGTYHATLKAWDNYGPVISYPITYVILPNSAPIKVKDLDNIILTAAGDVAKVNMHDYVQDPDGEVLSWKIDISDRSVVHVTQASDSEVLTVTALADSGVATIGLTATDAGGKSIAVQFSVLVRSESTGMQAYPNPVVNTLYISTGETPENAEISLISASGATVLHTVATCSAFEPAAIDVHKAAPGIYTLKVVTGGETHKTTIVKQ